jgi:arabinofuranosyltransferase
VIRNSGTPASAAPRPFASPKVFLLPAAALVLFAWIAVVTAWLSDDSLISLRQVWHAINGYGFTWNYGERVQAFTHPAWVLLLASVTAVTRELFYTTIFSSVLLSVASIWFVLRYATMPPRGRYTPYFLAGFLVALAFSKAFTDYMTSGLENPLSFFLIGLTVWQVGKIEHCGADARRLAAVFMILALAFLNRFDLALLLMPLALYLLAAHVGPSRLWSLVPGSALIVAWFSFAVVYFGAPLPNTYYAKVLAGFPAAEVHARGAAYFEVSWGKDPVTAALIVFGTVAGALSASWVHRSLSLGTVLYCAYLYGVGGDFMQGRFFAVLAYVAVFNLISIDDTQWPGRTFKTMALLATLGLVTIGPKPILSDAAYRNVERVRDIGDGRGFWYQNFGLLSPRRQWPEVRPPESRRPTRYSPTCAGKDGFVRGDWFLIDLCALTDPFLARLPAIRSPDWRIGHHFRKIPTDYGNVVVGRSELLADAGLQPLFDDVMLAATGPLFTLPRWQAILRLNGRGEYDFDRDRYADPAIHVPRSSLLVQVRHTRLARTASPDGTPWLRPQGEGAFGEWRNLAAAFDTEMLVIVRPSQRARSISLSLDAGAEYRITINQGEWVFDIENAEQRAAAGHLVSHVIALPESMLVSRVHIEAVGAEGLVAVGHLLFRDEE